MRKFWINFLKSMGVKKITLILCKHLKIKSHLIRKRPMCWLAIGFLLIICVFYLGRSYHDVLYVENLDEVTLEGSVVGKQYKESSYGGYWQVTLKKVSVLRKRRTDEFYISDREDERKKEIKEEMPELEENRKIFSDDSKIERLDGKYLCLIASDQFVDVKIGQRLLLKGTYKPWEEPRNPGQFNAGKYYSSEGILGQFQKCNIIKQGTEFSRLLEGMWQIRWKAHEFFRQKLGEEEGALISAMCLGEKSSLEEEDKNLYQRNGISHILAISGLHLMLLGMGVFRCLKITIGNDKLVTVIAIVIMSMYCVFTGNSISTIRATIMFALSLIAPILGRSYDSLSALGFSAILQLFMNPYILNHSGFLLSFLAVVGVTFFAPRLQELLDAKGKLSKSICVSISSTLATLPVLLCNYGTYPWYSIFLNLLILPAMSLLLFLAVLLLLAWMPEWLTAGASEGVYIMESFQGIKTGIVFGIKLILKYFEACCKIFEHAPFQDGYIGAPNAMQIICYFCLILVALSGCVKYSTLSRKMILMSAISILTLQINVGVELTMLDVGQGDSVVIRNQNGNLYISDCGSSSVSKVGKYRLVPFLKYKGYGKIKGIFLSHMDKDHMNGIMELLEMAVEEKLEIEYLFLPRSALGIEEDQEAIRELVDLAQGNGTRVACLTQGDKIVDGKMEFYCLYPKGIENEAERNNQSLVLLMQYEDFQMLLTGDIEMDGEKKLMEESKEGSLELLPKGSREESLELLPEGSKEESLELLVGEIDPMSIEVLKVAHHGSSGSSSEEFLKWIQPKLSLISCGKNNSYGHPHEETLQRLEEAGSKIMTTTECGAITIRIRKGKVKVEHYLDRN